MFLLGVLSVLILLALGILNADTFVSAKHPKLKDLVDRTTPYENYIGVAGVALGLLTVISSLAHFYGIFGLIGLLTGLLTIALGILSSSTYLKEQFLKNNAQAQAQLDKWNAKLAVYQENLGITGIVLAVLYLLLML